MFIILNFYCIYDGNNNLPALARVPLLFVDALKIVLMFGTLACHRRWTELDLACQTGSGHLGNLPALSTR